MSVGSSTEDRMAKKPSPCQSPAQAVTVERAARLYRLLRLLGTGPQPRERLMRRLHLDIRSFYRDLELLRTAGIAVWLQEGKYILEQTTEAAIARLPFPDPRLTVGEAMQLSPGRGRAQLKIRTQLARIVR